LSADHFGRTRWPDDAISRDVRGNRVPCFAKTYCTNPEQSKPVLGEVPPQRYGTPRYRSAVGSTRDADVARVAPIAARMVRAVALDWAAPPTSILTEPTDNWACACEVQSAAAHSAAAATRPLGGAVEVRTDCDCMWPLGEACGGNYARAKQERGREWGQRVSSCRGVSWVNGCAFAGLTRCPSEATSSCPLPVSHCQCLTLASAAWPDLACSPLTNVRILQLGAT